MAMEGLVAGNAGSDSQFPAADDTAATVMLEAPGLHIQETQALELPVRRLEKVDDTAVIATPGGPGTQVFDLAPDGEDHGW